MNETAQVLQGWLLTLTSDPNVAAGGIKYMNAN